MRGSFVNNIMRHLRARALGGADCEPSDHDLLRAVADGRDPNAFDMLLARHGALVWGVCRRVLGHEQDAEDAFQATFLLLARGASSVREGSALSSWLHGVAFRTAMRAKRDAARRRGRERAAAAAEHARPDLDAAWREVRAIIDEELQRLPPKYLPVALLCLLEGASRTEAARKLGLKEGTVSSRLAYARSRLQAGLIRRGIAVGLVPAAVTLATPGSASAVPAQLARATAAAAAAAKLTAGHALVGLPVSARVIALVQGAKRTMRLTKLTLGLAFCTGVWFGGAFFGSAPAPSAVARSAESDDKENPAKAEARRAAEAALGAQAGKPGPAKAVRGRILGPDGKPVAGAKLYAARRAKPAPGELSILAPNARQSGFTAEEVATSDTDGRFEARLPAGGGTGSEPGRLVALAKGLGFDWVSLDSARPGELTLRLVPDEPIRGRILDADGRPVAGARVRVNFVSTFSGDGLDRFLDNVKKGGYEMPVDRSWPGPLPGGPAELATDKDGRFTLAGVGRDRMVHFHLAGPAVRHWYFDVVTRAGVADAVTTTNSYATMKVHRATFDLVAEPARVIRGTVRDKATGKPLVGAAVSTPNGPTTHTARTDQNGRYELLGHPKAQFYQCEVRPADGQSYFTSSVVQKDAPGLDPITADVSLRPGGVSVTGRVLDGASKKPVAGVLVRYFPIYHRNSAERMRVNPSRGASSAVTGEDGSFRLAAQPGPGILAVECWGRHPYLQSRLTPEEALDFFKGKKFDGTVEDLTASNHVQGLGGLGGVRVAGRHHGLALINPDAKVAESLRQDVTLERGRTLLGTVFGPDGEALLGVKLNSTPLGTNAFRLQNLDPRRPTRQVFEHREKKLGAVLYARGDEEQPVTVRLRPYGSVSGRIVDKDGTPIPGVFIRVYVHGPAGGGESQYISLRAVTGKDGRFRIDDMPDGDTYTLGSPTHPTLKLSDGRPVVFPRFEVDPGKVKDLGDAKVE